MSKAFAILHGEFRLGQSTLPEVLEAFRLRGHVVWSLELGVEAATNRILLRADLRPPPVRGARRSPGKAKRTRT